MSYIPLVNSQKKKKKTLAVLLLNNHSVKGNTCDVVFKKEEIQHETHIIYVEIFVICV